MDPMPSGARGGAGNVLPRDVNGRGMMRATLASLHQTIVTDVASRRLCVSAVHLLAMDPMSSGDGHPRKDGADAAELGAGGAAQGADFGRAGAVLPAGAAAAGESGGRARTGA